MKLLQSLLIIALSLVAIAWKGFVLSKLWLWFIVSAFSVPGISISQAVGVGIVAKVLTYDIKSHKEAGEPYDEICPIVASFVAPAVYLFIGWVVIKLG